VQQNVRKYFKVYKCVAIVTASINEFDNEIRQIIRFSLYFIKHHSMEMHEVWKHTSLHPYHRHFDVGVVILASGRIIAAKTTRGSAGRGVVWAQ
jgi:hypothetical protein